MDYKITNICSDLRIGKSTLYKRINILKQTIPETDWKSNEYFYYTNDNKLFITEKGFYYIKNFNSKNDNFRQKNTNIDNVVEIYQNEIIEMYKKRIEYLENENKRLIDIIALKEQKEIAKDVKLINSNDNEKKSLFSKFLNKFNFK